MSYTVFIANVTAAQVAEVGQDLGLSGSVSNTLGFGQWGIEPSVKVELGEATLHDVARFVWHMFRGTDEEAVYVTFPNGKGVTLSRDRAGTVQVVVANLRLLNPRDCDCE